MCEHRIGKYCFNPKYLKPGQLANRVEDAPCCRHVVEKEVRIASFWTVVKS